MKKKLVLLTVLLLIASYLFAGDYVYWEDHKKSHSGKTTVHLKICFPKGYSDNNFANNVLRKLMNDLLDDGSYNYTSTITITEVHLSNGNVYRIAFGWIPFDGSGEVDVYKIKEHMPDYSPMELIYQFESTRYSTYNTFYDVYQTQCNKYLKMY